MPDEFVVQAARNGHRGPVKQVGDYVMKALVGGMLVVVPVYLALLLVFKVMQSLVGLVQPVARLFPEWLPAENLLSLLLLLVICLLIGAAIQTPAGRAARDSIERSFFERIPGYAVVRGLTQRLAGQGTENVWKPALAEIEEALVPAFIIEELDDGSFTVFVPSVPTPLAGAVYILSPERVHPLDIPFAQAIRCMARWGSGSKELVAAMKAQHR